MSKKIFINTFVTCNYFYTCFKVIKTPNFMS